MKRLLVILFVTALGAGCGSTQRRPAAPPDPSTFEELSAADYWAYKSNVTGKVINEWRSPDGIWQYGQYVVKRALDPRLTFELEREIDAEITRYFKVRTSALEETGAMLSPAIEATLVEVSKENGKIVIDRGKVDGVREGCYAAALLDLSEAKRNGLFPVMDRYYYERIKDVVAMFVVEEVEEHTATLKLLQKRDERGWHNLTEGAPVHVGFPPKWKWEILHVIPYAVQELPRLVSGYTREKVISKIAEFLSTRYDGDKATIDEMLKLLESNEPQTREVIVEALRRITGMNCGYQPEKTPEKNRSAVERWKRWWAKERSSFDGIRPKKRKKRDSRNDHLHDRGWGPS